jgi:hypothetical protein
MAEGKARKLLKGCLLVAAGLSLLFVVLVAAAVGWGLHANSVADREANAFCKATQPGESLAELEQRAHADTTMKHGFNEGEVYHFYYQGGVFYAAECEVTVSTGRVAKSRIVTHDD